MTLYFPARCLNNPQLAADNGCSFVEWFTSASIGASGKDALGLDFAWDIDNLFQRTQRMQTGSSLIVIDALEGPRQKATKQGSISCRAFIGAILHTLGQWTPKPIAFDGLPGAGVGWNTQRLGDTLRYVGTALHPAVTCYWKREHSLDDYLLRLDGVLDLYQAAMGRAPQLVLMTMDIDTSAFHAAPADHKRTVFARMQARGVEDAALWCNPKDKISDAMLMEIVEAAR